MKRNLQIISALILAFTWQNSIAQWTQVGQNINGQNTSDQLGFVVRISADGQTVAAGSPYASHPGFGVGHVQVFKNVAGTWTQEGQDLIGDNQGDIFGFAIDLSDDGSIIAISAPNNDVPRTNSGVVKIYENIGGTWTQLGQNIGGSSAGDQSGQSISLSGDGLSVAIGTPAHSYGGQVRVYKYTGGSWIQQGSDIDGLSGAFGTSVSLSNDGLTFVSGARGQSAGIETYEGGASVYHFDGTNWTQQGVTIFGEAENDNFGIAVSITGDGSIIAIGANNNDGAGNNAGHVRIFEYLGGAWTQIGQDIDGESANDQSGLTLSLSDNGSIVVIGAKGNSGGGSAAGHARVFENIGGTWTQKGLDIDGAAYDQTGWSVDISSNGQTVAIGTPYNDEGDVDAGQVKVYGIPSFVAVKEIDKDFDINIFPNPTIGQLCIESFQEKTIIITNAQGQLVERLNTASNTIDLSDLPKGVYNIQITTETGFINKTIIKE